GGVERVAAVSEALRDSTQVTAQQLGVEHPESGFFRSCEREPYYPRMPAAANLLTRCAAGR
ncbi:MAG TPA: hypothetical protein VKD25_02270, partial [Burkholderiales bacterium]|nr:hypothetical protein [Burkholderiales bacterium]